MKHAGRARWHLARPACFIHLFAMLAIAEISWYCMHIPSMWQSIDEKWGIFYTSVLASQMALRVGAARNRKKSKKSRRLEEISRAGI